MKKRIEVELPSNIFKKLLDTKMYCHAAIRGKCNKEEINFIYTRLPWQEGYYEEYVTRNIHRVNCDELDLYDELVRIADQSADNESLEIMLEFLSHTLE